MKCTCIQQLQCEYLSVQDINQALVDDGLVDMDKIGSSNFYWSFPSKVIVTKKNIVDSLEQKISQVSSQEP